MGAAGRMGRAIAAAAAERDLALAGGADQGGAILGPHGDAAALAAAADVLVDFSVPQALGGHLSAARTAGTGIVVGTTGLLPEHHALIDETAAVIPVLQAANTSLGVTLLAQLVRQAAARLGPDWDIEIVEMHHRMKVDAPSGTALLLGDAAAEGRAIDLAQHSERGRDGHTGARAEGSIGFASLRGGTVVGDHTVVLAGPGERLELGHRAEDRAVFARGAVAAALWARERRPGLYGMADVLGLGDH